MQTVQFPALPGSLAEAAVVQLLLRLEAAGIKMPQLHFRFEGGDQIRISVQTDDREAEPLFRALAQGWLEFVPGPVRAERAAECARDWNTPRQQYGDILCRESKARLPGIET
jgi:hypothetical protein